MPKLSYSQLLLQSRLISKVLEKCGPHRIYHGLIINHVLYIHLFKLFYEILNHSGGTPEMELFWLYAYNIKNAHKPFVMKMLDYRKQWIFLSESN